MIKNIVTYLDDKISALNLFSERLGLCEIIKETNEGGDEKSYPAHYEGSGEYKSASDYDLKDGLIYFRKNDNVSEEIAETQVACRTTYLRSYPIRIVAGKKIENKDDGFLADDLFEEIRNSIEGQSIKELKQILKAVLVNVVIDDYDTNRDTIFDEEYVGIDAPFPYTMAFVAINITVEVIATKKCFTNICTPPEDSLLCILINKGSVADVDQCLIGSGKKSEICGSFEDAKVFESDGATEVASLGSGDSFIIPKHDILLPDTITPLESKEFNEDTQLVRAYNKVPLTGQTTIYRTADDGDQRANNTYNYNTKGIRPILDPSDQTKLLNQAGNENSFGNFERFTDDLGGSDFAGRNYKLDHYTGYAATYDFINPAGLTTWNANIDWADGLDHRGFTDYRVPNVLEFATWIKWDSTNRFLFTLLNFNNADRFATSTSDTSTLHFLAHNSLREIRRQSNNNFAFAMRDHFI